MEKLTSLLTVKKILRKSSAKSVIMVIRVMKMEKAIPSRNKETFWR